MEKTPKEMLKAYVVLGVMLDSTKDILGVWIGEAIGAVYPHSPVHLKRPAGFKGDGLKGFDTVTISLPMQTYVTVHSFEYACDKHGKPHGCSRYGCDQRSL